MRIDFNTTCYTNSCRNNTTFRGKKLTSFPTHRRTAFTKFFAPVIAGTMMLSGFTGCNTERTSGQEDVRGINVEYYDIKPETKDIIFECFDDFVSKLDDSNNFLNGTNLILTNRLSSLENKNSFVKYIKNYNKMKNAEGMSFYSDNKIPRRILIQESAHTKTDVMYNYTMTGDKTKKPLLRHTLKHEIGHQFDEYFGHDHNAKFARNLDSVLYLKELNPYENPYGYNFNSQEEKNIFEFYHNNNSLSDKNRFKEAYYKDLLNILDIIKTNPNNLPLDLDYYTKGVDFNTEITPLSVDKANRGRCEAYANLFSYALGENDGDKVDFINAFPNSYEVVKKDIENFLGEEIFQE